MKPKPEDLCPRPDFLPPLTTQPLAAPIFTSAVYRCESPAQAARLLAAEETGFVYSRDGHPNGMLLAEKCRQLHGADDAVVCGSGMSALTLAAVATVRAGDQVLISNQLYGRTAGLFGAEFERFNVHSSTVDVCDLAAVECALAAGTTRLVVVESISNPLLRVCDLAALAKISHDHGARLLVDNTFAGPTVCRPLELGADLVVESLTKIMSGHSDVLLGMLCGRRDAWQRVAGAQSTWGWSSSPFDCWLAARGLASLALRAERAGANAIAAAHFLATRDEISVVHFPGLATHPDHALAKQQFQGQFGTMVTFTLAGGRPAAEKFIAAAHDIPFCPSLGDISTTLSHPESTSHRSAPAAAREAQGIFGGTIRLSLGVESAGAIVAALLEGFAGLV